MRLDQENVWILTAYRLIQKQGPHRYCAAPNWDTRIEEKTSGTREVMSFTFYHFL